MILKRLSLTTVILLLAIAGCGGDEGADTPSDVATPASAEATATDGRPAATSTPGVMLQRNQAGSFFSINEVGLGPDGYVTLTNFTEVPVSVDGLHLCQGADCFALPDAEVAAGETARIAVGNGQGLENVIATGATIGELRPADGELAIFKSDQTDSPEELLNYFQWGLTPHDLTAVAIEAGLWVEGGYGPSGPNATRLFRNLESGLWLWE